MGAVLLRFIAVVQPNNLPQLTAAGSSRYSAHVSEITAAIATRDRIAGWRETWSNHIV
jgi:hypothetical protein